MKTTQNVGLLGPKSPLFLGRGVTLRRILPEGSSRPRGAGSKRRGNRSHWLGVYGFASFAQINRFLE